MWMRCALLVVVLVVLAEGSHFRGATISWKADPSVTGKVQFSFRIAWRRTSSNNYCDSSTISSGSLIGSSSSWTNSIGGSSVGSLGSIQYYCTDYSASENWSAGGNTFDYTFSGTQTREISYGGCCWISEVGGGSWTVRTTVDLTPRSDLMGRPNSSPVSASSPVVRIIQHCNSVIRIPAEDPDGDAVRCRWGTTTAECNGVCGAVPRMTLDEKTCTLQYNTSSGLIPSGWHAAALILEDFKNTPSCASNPSGSGCGPFSQVPLQFLIYADSSLSSTPCDKGPKLVGQTPADKACIAIPPSTTYTAVIEAEAQNAGATITEIGTISPVGLTKTSLATVSNNPHRAKITATWTPTPAQAGQHLFCFRARDSNGFESDQRCVTLLAGDTPVIPAADLSSRTPTTGVRYNQQINWTLTFDTAPEKPQSPKFIRFFNKANTEVHTIDTSTSADVSIVNNTLKFTTAANVLGAGQHYILMDAGAVVGPSNCAGEGPPFVGISDKNVWKFDTCPSGFDDHWNFGKCLYVHKKPRDYATAKTFCQNKGGKLFLLNNNADVTKLKGIMTNIKNTSGRKRGVWIGLTDSATEGTFLWEGGAALGAYTDWAPGQPAGNSQGLDCVQMKVKYQWKWKISRCTTKNAFICEAV